MTVVVLGKAVPDAETIRFDPERRSVVRDGSELRLNPFDQRALRVALELARPGEPVRLISLGPESAAPCLAEAVRLGLPEAELLTDPSFGGSDVLATARALSAAARRLSPDVILAGDRSTDSDTGLVGPEVAGLLGIPVVTGARGIRRDEGARMLEVTVGTGSGWRRLRVGTPALVTVSEKIAKPLRLDGNGAARDVGSALSRVGPSELGIRPDQVGVSGSPTRVVGVDAVAPQRSGVVYRVDEGEDWVVAPLEKLAPLLEGPVAEALPLPAETQAPDAPRFAILASDELGGLDGGALGWFARVRRKLPGWEPLAVWLGPGPSEEAERRLSADGSLAGWKVPAATGALDSRGAATALARVLDLDPRIAALALTAGARGREVAGQLAAFRGLGAVGDVTDLRLGETRALQFLKPSFGGATLATIESRSHPTIATLRPGLFAPERGPAPRRPWGELEFQPPAPAVQLLDAGEDPVPQVPPPDREVVVTVGMGTGGPAGVELAARAAERWGASLAGTRRVVDAGWLPQHAQVGLTGASLAPRLAVLLGVRGSSHHMIGWRRARAVLAVNTDPEAPVFAESDVGVIGPVERVLPALIEPVARLLARTTEPR